MMETNQDNLIRPNERLDDLGRDGLMIIQDPKKFCFGIDAVLLTDFAQAKEGDRLLDMGTGTGIIPVLLSSKTPASELIGLEIQEDMAEMAARSVAYNRLQGKVKIVCGDIKEADSLFGKESFNVITCNPPYMAGGDGLTNPDMSVAIARHEIKVKLEDIICQGSRLLKTGGKFYMIHRPHRMAEVIELMREYKLEPKRLRMVHPYIDKEANMFLIEAAKGGGSFMKVEPPIIVYKKGAD